MHLASTILLSLLNRLACAVLFIACIRVLGSLTDPSAKEVETEGDSAAC